MKLQQLECLASIAQSELSITAAAKKLNSTQPAVSRQLKRLEHELGFSLFVRNGRSLERITPAGQRVLAHALRVVRETHNIEDVSEDVRDEGFGLVTVGTTHTEARYVLPALLKEFRVAHPRVRLHLHQGTPAQLASMAREQQIDIPIASGSRELFTGYFLLPSHRWHWRVLVPRGHALARIGAPSLRELASHPIITYDSNLAGPQSLREVFTRAGLELDVTLSAQDSDVIKTYVRLGLGVGIVAGPAYEPERDRDLVAIDVDHLLPAETTWIGFARGRLMRYYMGDFIRCVAPHLDGRVVTLVERCTSQREVDELIAGIEIPVR